MICSFRKLSSKNLSLLSVIRLLHTDKDIQIKHNPYLPLDVLEVNKQNKIHGGFSIMNYLTLVKRDSEAMEKFWWLAFHFQSKNQEQSVTIENLQRLERWLKTRTFIEGDHLTESDVIAYVKLKKLAALNQSDAITQWSKTVGQQVDPIVEQILKEFSGAKLIVKKEPKTTESEVKKDQSEKPQKQQQPKQDKQAVVAQKVKKQPEVQQKQPKTEEAETEYTLKIKGLKVKRNNHGQPILPVSDNRNILITSALPYVNNVPHLGNIIGCVLSADVYARYCRLRGYNTLYISGTDEYGTATEVKAMQEKCSPEEICAKYFKIHSDCYKWFDIDFDYFGRTSTQIHTQITQDIFNHLHPKYTTTHTRPQTYCAKCAMFLADRYVQGTCPSCKFDDARGDQCDGCSKLLDPVDLVNSRCVVCKSPPEIRDTTHIYINLPTIQPQLETWITQAQNQGNWSENSVSVSKAWLKQGLIERCITRDLKWGTPVPLEEFKHKVFYVWFDAPIGYLSITGNFIQDWKSWWMNPDNVKLYQFMGKDNVPFHTVIFPSTLIGTGQNYTLLHRVSTTEYLNYEDSKFSKTRGVGVFGDNIQETGIPSEVIRYYLLINRPEKSDTVFTWQDFGMKNNNELLPNIGNLINRAFKFIYKNFDKKVPQFSKDKLLENDSLFLETYLAKFDEYIVHLEKTEIKDGLKKAMEMSSTINKYLQDEKAWEKEQLLSKRSEQILGVTTCAIRLLSAVLEPYMPSLSAKINFLLGFESRTLQDDHLIGAIVDAPQRIDFLLSLVPVAQQLNEPVSLFRLYSQEELEAWRTQYGGKQQS